MEKQNTIVIFSKDRANQLYSCIRSLYENFKQADQCEINILYSTTTEEYENGYRYIKNLLNNKSNINWIQETNFNKNLQNLILKTNTQFIMFLVDDIIFVNKLSLDDQQISLLCNPNILAVSCRLHSNVTQCYATGEETTPPKFVKKCVWNWKNVKGDWNYPMSVDGNIYKTDLIQQIIKSISRYNNPNTFEAMLDSVKLSPGFPEHMCCYPEAPRLINIPANRVQNTFQNKYYKSYTTKELNDILLNGKQIKIQNLLGIKPNSVHVPLDYEFEDI